jgi:hypothetical protein
MIKNFIEEYVKNNPESEFDSFNDQESGLLKTRFILVRYLTNKNVIQFGWRKNFDRWANSVDWWTEIPGTYNELVWLINYCEYLGASGENNSGWGEEVKITMRDAKEHSKKLIKALSIMR